MITTHSNVFSLLFLKENEEKDLLISGHKDGVINVWNLDKNSLLKSYKEHKSFVDDLKHLKENMFLSCGNDKLLKIWDLNSNISIQTIENDSWTFCVSPLKNYRICNIVTGDDNKLIKIWNLVSGKVLASIPSDHKHGVGRLLHISNKPPYNLLLSSSNPDIKLWNLDNNLCLRTFREHSDWVNALVYIKDDQFCSGSGDKLIKIWSLHSSISLKTISVHKSYVSSLLYLNDLINEDVIITGCLGRKSKIIDYTTGKVLKSYDRSEDIFKMIPSVKSDSIKIASCFWGSNNILVWGSTEKRKL